MQGVAQKFFSSWKCELSEQTSFHVNIELFNLSAVKVVKKLDLSWFILAKEKLIFAETIKQLTHVSVNYYEKLITSVVFVSYSVELLQELK